MISPVLCTRSIVVTVIASYVGETGRALKIHMSEHHRAVEKMDFSASALAQHALEHMCTTGQDYPDRQSTSVGSPLPSIGTA